MLYQSEGIVLDQQDLGETDKLSTIFTEEEGLVKAVVKGGAKRGSKLRGLTQPFTYGLFQLWRGRNFDRVTQVSVKDSFPLIMEDYEKMVYGRYVAELLITVLPERVRDQNQFRFVLSVFRCLEEKDDPWVIARWAELGILSLGGFAPTFSSCISCEKSLGEGPVYFSLRNGGALCADCIDAHSTPREVPEGSQIRQYDEIIKISPGALRTLQILSSKPISGSYKSDKLMCPRINAVGQVREEITLLLRKYMAFVLEKRLRSANLVESIEDARR